MNQQEFNRILKVALEEAETKTKTKTWEGENKIMQDKAKWLKGE